MDDFVLPLLKARKGISTESRDPLLKAIIKGIIDDCRTTHGIVLDKDNGHHVIFVLDWATWKYSHPEDGTTPRSIQFRLHNLVIREGAKHE